MSVIIRIGFVITFATIYETIRHNTSVITANIIAFLVMAFICASASSSSAVTTRM